MKSVELFLWYCLVLSSETYLLTFAAFQAPYSKCPLWKRKTMIVIFLYIKTNFKHSLWYRSHDYRQKATSCEWHHTERYQGRSELWLLNSEGWQSSSLPWTKAFSLQDRASFDCMTAAIIWLLAHLLLTFLPRFSLYLRLFTEIIHWHRVEYHYTSQPLAGQAMPLSFCLNI